MKTKNDKKKNDGKKEVKVVNQSNDNARNSGKKTTKSKVCDVMLPCNQTA